MTDPMFLLPRMHDMDARIQDLESEHFIRPTDTRVKAQLAALRRRRAKLEAEWQDYLKPTAPSLEANLQQLRRQTRQETKGMTDTPTASDLATDYRHTPVAIDLLLDEVAGPTRSPTQLAVDVLSLIEIAQAGQSHSHGMPLEVFCQLLHDHIHRNRVQYGSASAGGSVSNREVWQRRPLIDGDENNPIGNPKLESLIKQGSRVAQRLADGIGGQLD